MVTAEMYKNYLSSYGSNLAQVKKNQSDAAADHAECFISTTDGRYCKTDTVYLSGVFCNRRNWGVIVNACIYDEVWNKRNLDGGFSFCFGIL